MNFLEICQTARSRCRMSGDGPVSVVTSGQSEEYRRLIGYVNEAWNDIQKAEDQWQWMRAPCTFPTVAGKALYTAQEIGITDLANWCLSDDDRWTVYSTAGGQAGELWLEYLDYRRWSDIYEFGTGRTSQSQPALITITPNKSIGLGATPTAGYTVTGNYFKAPSNLVSAGDIPAMPTRFHMAIVYRVMALHGASEAASEIYQEGRIEFGKEMRRLRSDQLPEIVVARP